MASACHLSQGADQCYSDLTDAVDARAGKERLKIEAYADDGGMMFGALPKDIDQTAEKRATVRQNYCA